jgi:hypothetical protein
MAQGSGRALPNDLSAPMRDRRLSRWTLEKIDSNSQGRYL